MGARHSGREAALQLLFSMEASGQTAAEAIEGFWHTFGADPEGREYAEAIVQGVEKDKAELDAMITAAAKNWRIERMTRIDRNLLRLGVWELAKQDDVPRAVVIDEAVELAKSFGSDASASFVNGVLDAIADTLKKV
jgi:transcription antitermination protein NusB